MIWPKLALGSFALLNVKSSTTVTAAATPPPTATQNQGLCVSDPSSFPEASPELLDWVSRVEEGGGDDVSVTAAGGGGLVGIGASAIGAAVARPAPESSPAATS